MSQEPVRPRLPALTSLRFFAAFHVVLFHLYAMKIVEGSGWYRKLASIGYVGVSLFFVLSGFILVYTYAGREWTAWEFWRARFARVYPAYFFSLFLTAPFFFYVALYMDVPFYAWFKRHLALCAVLVPTLLQSWIPNAALAWNAPAWSLSDEGFFYAVFPLVVVWLLRARVRSLATWLIVFWVVSLSLSSAYAIFQPDGVAHVTDDMNNLTWLNAVKFLPLARLPEFLMGACLGFLFLRGPLDRKWATPLVIGGVVAFAVVITVSPHIPYTILHDSLLAPVFGAIIYGLALRPGWAVALEKQPMILLGDSSYSLYLLHSLVLGAYFAPGPTTMRHNSIGGIIGGMSLAIAVGIFVYLLIEQPARRKLRPKPKPRPAIAEEAAKAW